MKKVRTLFLCLAAVAVILRIAYINVIQYPAPAVWTCAVNETAVFRDFEFTVTGSRTYTASQLQALFGITDSAYLDETEIVLSMHVKNTGEETKRLDVSSFALEYGCISGGGVNLLLFYAFNADLSDLTFEPGGEQEILLPYPLIAENPHLILSLYPQKIIMNLE